MAKKNLEKSFLTIAYNTNATNKIVKEILPVFFKSRRGTGDRKGDNVGLLLESENRGFILREGFLK